MQTLLVVNGEDYWTDYFPDLNVRPCRLQDSRWHLREDGLWVLDGARWIRVDAVLWRLGAVRPHPSHRSALEIIRLSGVPCFNAASVLLRGYDRLAMLSELREIGLPTVPFSVALGDRVLEREQPHFPCVIKIGNLHGGWGKARAANSEQWSDILDLSFASEDYATVEPFIDYEQDVRCLCIGEELWAMSRRSSEWKVNRGVAEPTLIKVPPLLLEYSKRLQKHLRADFVALDCLQTRDGKWYVLEYNDIPGLSGFPQSVRESLARCVRKQL
jgi:ribosomal protein S6--L-glutamate ligase